MLRTLPKRPPVRAISSPIDFNLHPWDDATLNMLSGTLETSNCSEAVLYVFRVIGKSVLNTPQGSAVLP